MEQQFIRWLRDRLPTRPEIPVGIGDDAAVLQFAPHEKVVVSTDMLTEGVDFELAKCQPKRVGRKALAVNLSDLAAMAARPVAAFISLALPRVGGFDLAQQLYSGIIDLAREFDVAIAGGDTNSWDGPLVMNVTVLGAVNGRGALLRRGAKPGDAILVTGSFGGSILGKHFDFTPRVREALLLHNQFELHAGIDVSDGLSLDLARLAQESGCGAELDLAAIPIAPDAQQLCQQETFGLTPLDHALSDGEDFELILAAPPGEAERLIARQPLPIEVRKIGSFIAQPGLWGISENRERRALAPRGYEHKLT